MTEREKRILGLPHYLFKEPEILEEITKTKDLCYEYNQVRPSDSVAQNEILEKIFQKRYENIKIWSPFQCFHGKNIKIGQNFFANHNFIVIDMCEVIIGNNVMIGPNVTIITANHPKSPKQRKENLEFGAKVVIEDDVWIGANSIVLPGVVIGKHSVVAAGSVVSQSIPSYCVCAGIPARVIKKYNFSSQSWEKVSL